MFEKIPVESEIKIAGHFHTRLNVSILPVNPNDSENLVENYQTKIIGNTTHND
jgi:hypothetical protein